MKFIILMLTLLNISTINAANVLAISGSLRSGSLNTELVNQAAAIAASKGASVKSITLNQFPMPFYNEDLEKGSGMPNAAKQLRSLMLSSDVILIASPEYNATCSGVLKNALDWASRSEQGSYSNDAFKGKRFALMSASPGGGGGARAISNLKAIITTLGGTVIPMEVSVPHADQAKITTNPQVKQELTNLVEEALKGLN
jgi:Predicted flavoprotein